MLVCFLTHFFSPKYIHIYLTLYCSFIHTFIHTFIYEEYIGVNIIDTY